MFKGLMKKLHETYQGNEIYIPDAIYPLVKDWMERTYFEARVPDTAHLKWRGKILLPYDEENILTAYQTCPIHVPARILEKSIVIETSLEMTYREEVVVPKPEIVVEEKKPTRKKIKKRRRRYDS